MAAQLGVSRAAVYRMEKGEIVKIDTLERLARILGTSMASIMGVEVEYYASAIACMERMRQLEEGAARILAHFEPLSYLLTSDDYSRHLAQMLRESGSNDEEKVTAMMTLLDERRQSFARNPRPIVNLVGLRELERFVHFGLVGKTGLSASVRARRSEAARREVERVASLLDEQPMGIQIGLVQERMPNVTFQVFEGNERSHVVVSPFRFGEFPNMGAGIATVTASPEAVALYTGMVEELWARSVRGPKAAELIRAMLRTL